MDLNEQSLGEKLKVDVQEDARLDTKNLMEEREKIIEELERRKVIDLEPKETEKMKKRLNAINAQLNSIYDQDKEEQIGTEAEEQALGDEEKAIEEQAEVEIDKEEKEQIDDGDESIVPPSYEDKLPEEESEEKGLEDEKSLKVEYYTALVAYYDRVISDSKKQIANNELVSSKEDFSQEIKLETEMYKARDRYMALGKEDPYSEKRTELIRASTEAKEPAELELRRRAAEYRRLEIEMARLTQEEQEINERLLSEDVNEVERGNLKRELEENSIQKRDIGIKLSTIKEGLIAANEIRDSRDSIRSELISKEISTLTNSDKANYRYQEDKKDRTSNDITQAQELEYDNIKRNIEAKEREITELNKQLNELSDSTDFATRIALVEQLDTAVNDLNVLKENKNIRDNGVQLEGVEAATEAKNTYDNKEYNSKELQEELAEVKQYTDIIEEKAGREAVNNPSPEDRSYTDGKINDKLEAAVITTVISDTPEEMIGTYVGTRVIQKVERSSDPFRANLQDKVVDVETEEGAKQYLGVAEKADNELDKVTERVQQQI